MPVAEIITIGTELLLGEIQDTNTSFIAKTLNTSGIDVFHASIIGDNEERIANEIRLALKRADIIITTGGLGPTVDDPTRAAVARAFGRNTEFRPELWEQVIARFRAYDREPSENNKRQAFIPEGSVAITNPVGTAPAFYVEENNKIVFSLPGVPSEMKTLLLNEVLPIIKIKFNFQSTLVIRTLHTAGIGESSVDEIISNFEKMKNPMVGLAAHPGQVDIRISAKSETAETARQIIKPVEAQIRKLLGDAIFGEDGITLAQTVAELLQHQNLAARINFEDDLSEIASLLAGCLNLPSEKVNHLSTGKLENEERLLYNLLNNTDVVINLKRQMNTIGGVDIEIIFRGEIFRKSINFGGHPAQRNRWAENHILNYLREMLLNKKEAK